MNSRLRPAIEWRALLRPWWVSKDGSLVRIGRGYLRFVPLVMLLGLLASVLEGVGIGLLIPLVALLMANSDAGGVPGPLRAIARTTDALEPEQRVFALAAVVLSLILLKSAVQAANGTFIAAIEGRIGRDLRDALSAKILSLDFSFFMKNDPNRLAHIIANDGWYVMEASRWTLTVVPAAAGLAVFSALLLWFDWRLFLIVLAGAALIQGVLYLFERRQRRLSLELTASAQVLWDRMLGIVDTIRVIRVFGQETREQQRFSRAAERKRRAEFATQRVHALVTPSMDLMIAALFVLILVSAYAMGATIPTTIAFLVLLSRLQPHANAITKARLGIAAVRGSIREVKWLLAQHAATLPIAATIALPDARQPIRFERVSYAYPDGSVALSDVSWVLQPGVATALIGRSGSGKTTLVNLLCRLIEPTSGAIYLGDRRLDEIAAPAWRGRIGIAGQDIDLLDGTIAENIAYGRPGAPHAEIERAAAMAGAEGFIAALPHGYESNVGHEGLNLSGGQRQRIGLARALLRNPDLLILDEATSAVDALSEREIMDLLANHRHFHTALVISHRRSTLALCQHGVVIEDGMILEAGPLEALRYYRDMAGEAGPAARG